MPECVSQIGRDRLKGVLVSMHAKCDCVSLDHHGGNSGGTWSLDDFANEFFNLLVGGKFRDRKKVPLEEYEKAVDEYEKVHGFEGAQVFRGIVGILKK